MYRQKTRLLAWGALITLLLAGAVMGGAPRLINFQGRVTDAAGVAVPDGNLTVTFRIYDAPVAGTLLWEESGVTVTVTDGLFTAALGAVVPLAPELFTSFGTAPPPSELWAEVVVGAEVLAPRTQLISVPFAQAAQDISGKSVFDSDMGIRSFSEYALLSTFGWEGEEKIRLWGDSWGEIFLYDSPPTTGGASTDLTAVLTASRDGGAYLYLGDGEGSQRVYLNGIENGDGSVEVPDDAINSFEMFNEPGIATAFTISNSPTFAKTTASTTDVLAVTITIPDDGYIVLDGNVTLVMQGVGVCFAFMQISETSASPLVGTDFIWMNSQNYANDVNAIMYQSALVKKVYFKTAGTYTFYLQGNEWGGNDPANVVFSRGTNGLTATYFPTSYGAVTTPVATAGGGESVSPLPSSSTRNTVETTDLRTLELAAKEAKIRALEAEAALNKARLEAAASQNSQLPTPR